MNQPAGFEGGRLLVVAFEGWNDAGEAATGAAKLLGERLGLVEIAAVDPELYFDYQFTRPTVVVADDGVRRLEWPGAAILGPGGTPTSDDEERVTGPGAATLHVLIGAEPGPVTRSSSSEVGVPPGPRIAAPGHSRRRTPSSPTTTVGRVNW